MINERANALLETLEAQAQQRLEELARLRLQLEALEAENSQLRKALQQSTEAAQAALASPRRTAEQVDTTPQRAMPDVPEPPVSRKPADTEGAAQTEAAQPASQSVDSPSPAKTETPQSPLAAGEAPSPQALLNEWYRRYTDTFFKGHTRPLKVGIHEDLLAREPWPDKLVRRALACYVHLPRYLKAVREGAERVDLDGQPAGVVDEGEAQHASKQLETLQAQQQARTQQKKQASEARSNARLDHKLGELLAKHGRN